MCVKNDMCLACVHSQIAECLEPCSSCYRNSNFRMYLSEKLPTISTIIDNDFIPTKIIFSGPATICYFANGDKQIVKRMNGEIDDDEKAVMFCIMKHIMKIQPMDLSNKYGYFKRQVSEKIEEEKKIMQEQILKKIEKAHRKANA